MAVLTFDTRQTFDMGLDLFTYSNVNAYEIPNQRWSYVSNNNNRSDFFGNDLIFVNSAPAAGTVDSLKIWLGNVTTRTPDLTVTGLTLDFAKLADLVNGGLTNTQQNDLYWAQVLLGNDTIKLGDGTYSVTVAGDGRETYYGSYITGNDTFTGDVRYGKAVGDYLRVLPGDRLYAGNDVITISGLTELDSDVATKSWAIGDVQAVGGQLIAGDDKITDVGNSSLAYVVGDVVSVWQISAVALCGDDILRGGRLSVGDVYTDAGNVSGGDDLMYGATVTTFLYGDVSTVTTGGVLDGGDDTIYGYGEGDRLVGDAAEAYTGSLIKGGDDILYGNGGDDYIAGDWIDIYFRGKGTGGDDKLYGAAGDDQLYGNPGNDLLDAGADDDLLKGGTGKDRLDGGSGYDTGDNRDRTEAIKVTLKGYGETIVYVNGVAEDTMLKVENVYGGSGADTLTGDLYKNYLYGAGGNDLLKGGVGLDRLNGGSAYDTADYRDQTTAVKVALKGHDEATVYVDGVAEDVILEVENIYGGSAADSLTGDSYKNYLYGAAGIDILKGGGGMDRLNGGDGYDTADYRDKTTAVRVELKGYDEAIVYVTSVAEDTILKVENVYGGSYDDTLTGDSYRNYLYGAAGNDYLKGGAGIDRLNGGDGYDTADYSDKTQAVKVTLKGYDEATVYVNNVAEDTILKVENLRGGSGNDTLVGDLYRNSLNGGLGNDTLTGGGGADFFFFDTPSDSSTNHDTITDFNESGDDILFLYRVFLPGFTLPGQLSADAYVENAQGIATTADHRIIYETDTGFLRYDSNGSADGGVQFHFATLDANKASSYSSADFVVL